MPQFETSFYLTQIIWMLGSFSFLYVMMAFLICPMIEDVLEERRQKIQRDLDLAESLNKQAEILHQRYQAFTLTSEKEKDMRIREAYAQIQKDATTMEKKNEKQLRQKVRQAEKKIEKVRSEIQDESKRLSEQIAENFANRLMKKGDLDA